MTAQSMGRARAAQPCLSRLGVILALLLATLLAAAPAAGIRYVDASAGGADSGASWADAYAELKGALPADEAGR